MRTLIVGGAGVIATEITPYLQRLGHEVVVLSPDAPTAADVQWVNGDATDFDDLAVAMDGVDAVINFALRPSRGADEETGPVRTAMTVGVTGTYAQLRVAARSSVPAFCQISSLAVYEGFGHRLRSAEEPADGTGLYALTKRMAELACAAEADRTPSMSITALRLAYPTRAERWPRWCPPVVEDTGRVPSVDGVEHAALHPEDLAAAVDAAVRRTDGGYRCVAITADTAGVALADQDASALGWRPQHTLADASASVAHGRATGPGK